MYSLGTELKEIFKKHVKENKTEETRINLQIGLTVVDSFLSCI